MRSSLFGGRCAALAAGIAIALGAPASAQVALPPATKELQTVVSAQTVLDEFGGLQIESIPPAMLSTAQGIAIFPNMIKGGFILGVNYGQGVLMVRRNDGSWSPPAMVTMGGGSLGFQAGVQAADIVLVFATPRSLEGMLRGDKVTLGADANVALGPIGRSANAGTDARMGAEIYSYARARGLFLGVSVNGASISMDPNANAMLYGRAGITPADIYNANGLAYHQEVANLINDDGPRQATAGAGARCRGRARYGGAPSRPAGDRAAGASRGTHPATSANRACTCSLASCRPAGLRAASGTAGHGDPAAGAGAAVASVVCRLSA
jgi:lipid-binding SYLF domain-containing protein